MAEGAIPQSLEVDKEFSNFDINDIPEDLINKIWAIEKQNDMMPDKSEPITDLDKRDQPIADLSKVEPVLDTWIFTEEREERVVPLSLDMPT